MSYYRPGLFPPAVKNLIIINALIFLAQVTYGSSHPNEIETLFGLHDVRSVYFHPFQLLTYMFLHGGFPHLFGNMLGVWVFGSMLENHLGVKRFLQLYLISGIAGGLLHLGVLYVELTPLYNQFHNLPSSDQLEWINEVNFDLNVYTVGASGALFGCLAGAAYLFPNTIIYLNFLFPVKMKWLALVYGAYELFAGVRNSAGDNVAHFAHLGGAVAAIILIWIWNKTNRRTFY